MSVTQVSNDACFQQSEVTLKVAILPVHSAQPIDAVKQQLNNLLFKYSETLDGVPLSFSDLKFPKGKEYARIMTDQFWLHVDVCTKLLMFRPVVGSIVNGKINKISDNHISILIFALFNASISEQELRKKFTYNASLLSW
jgi:DNA-directed RNA polymerase subunit E'/Rpb7